MSRLNGTKSRFKPRKLFLPIPVGEFKKCLRYALQATPSAFLDKIARSTHEKSKAPARTFLLLIAILRSQQTLPSLTTISTA
jgi:hypothetical protein